MAIETAVDGDMLRPLLLREAELAAVAAAVVVSVMGAAAAAYSEAAQSVLAAGRLPAAEAERTGAEWTEAASQPAKHNARETDRMTTHIKHL
jgi:invasion protein IalB